ncbi:hypothetical protein IJD44_11200 [bacterium]|nr:hypothetical protein [bacterium]
MFDFDNDGDFDLMDIVESDIQYGFFEEDDKIANLRIKKQVKNKKQKVSGVYSNFNYL